MLDSKITTVTNKEEKEIVKGMRKTVKTLYSEGYEEIFALSVIDDGLSFLIQVSDFSLNAVDLPKKYEKTYEEAEKLMTLAKSVCGDRCTAVSTLICDEVDEDVYLDGNVLRVMNLNI